MKVKRLFCDPMIAAGACGAYFLSVPLSFFIVWDIFFYDTSWKRSIGDTICVIIVLLIVFGWFAILTYCSTSFFASVKLTEKCVIYKCPFHRKKIIEYDHFKFVKIASYMHIHTRRYFLVISQKTISPSVMIHINQIKCSDKCIKIKLSNRNYRILCYVLPDNIKQQLQCLNNDALKDVVFDIDREKKRMQKKAKKKKQHRKK